ncbi:hypothetical protein SAMN04488063_0622 [Halopelagius inordinatus]|uniref:Uncharacterized protein n=1 Tax=Halopelagius inordinatus TaxID=553467 RepID=A0A1I2M9W0_9EURY|nr:hypothetical protein [Halopelagius inordinatus]SFF87668.1 hypothetical protein SAMN04488063_0622 [Halopelagius inordinatus]
MVSSAVKTAVATSLILVGVAGVVGSTMVPTTTCTETRVDGEVVRERCQTDESLRNVTLSATGFGLVFAIVGTVAVGRYSDGTDPVVDVVSGVVLLLVGVFVTYLFGVWLWNLLTASTLRGRPSLGGLMELLAFTAIGSFIAAIGVRSLWKVVQAWRRRGT